MADRQVAEAQFLHTFLALRCFTMSDEQSVVDLPRLYDMLMESGEQLMRGVAQGNGVLTADELREILVDMTNNYEDHEVAVAMLLIMSQNRTYFMDRIMEVEPAVWTMQVSVLRRTALGQSEFDFIKAYNESAMSAEAVDPVAQATFLSIPNGSVMASIGLEFFARYPNAAKSWGRWTRALLVVLWGFTATGDVEAITGVEALAMWTQATTVINEVLQGLPTSARLQMRG